MIFWRFGKYSKPGASSVSQQGIDTGANYLKNKINGMGAVSHGRIVRHKVSIKQNHMEVVVVVGLYIQQAMLLKFKINFIFIIQIMLKNNELSDRLYHKAQILSSCLGV
jgi:hypothetical protein